MKRPLLPQLGIRKKNAIYPRYRKRGDGLRSAGRHLKALRCPWCGTSNHEIRTNCPNCGGPLPEREPEREDPLPSMATKPPPPPRAISKDYARKLVLNSGWGVAGGIFALVGVIFFFVGVLLTVPVVTAFVGIPFAGMGAIFGAAGFILLKNQFDKASQTVGILQQGQDTEGLVTGIEENLMVRINGRHPFTIRYEYTVGGRHLAGEVQTLRNPSPVFRQGSGAWVLYSPDSPDISTLYPHP